MSQVLVLTLGCVWGWESLPAIPSGRRAEYYLLNDDGAYKYGYDTGSGQSATVNGDSRNQVQGQYQYVDKDGQRVALSYTAGDAGFVPQHLPGPIASAIPTTSGAASTYQSALPQGSVDEDYDSNADASYSFDIDTDSYKRTETSDPRGNIRGKYSYSSPIGGSHALSYSAGEGTGFVVTGSDSNSISNNAYISHAPSPYSRSPAANTRSSLNKDGSYSFSYNTADQSREESGDAYNNIRGSYSFKANNDGLTRRVDYAAGADTGFVAQGSHLPVAPTATNVALAPIALPLAYGYPATQLNAPVFESISAEDKSTSGGLQSDGSYSFSYDAGDHSRQETGDSHNNIHGSFSFRAKDDGLTRRVDYQAGPATGFVAKGVHLPVTQGFAVPSSDYTLNQGNSAYPGSNGAYSSDYDLQTDAVSTYSADEGSSGDASYSFSYSTGDSSRKETSDAHGNVKGQYSFVAKDGIQRKLDYTAGAGIGFVVKGGQLPAGTDIGYTAGVVGYSTRDPGYTGATQYSDTSSGIHPDGSYSFSYQAGDHIREESADAKNNVRGSFSYSSKDDGQARRVDYQAGAGIGFIAKGSHLPGASSNQIGYSIPSDGTSDTYGQANSHQSSGDGSYSFSYNAGDHSREESGDPYGNVRGRFSFVAKDDGQTRHVEYEAGAEKGFIAQGAHLPVPGAPIAIKSYKAATGSSDGLNGDPSYSYSYQTDSSSKQESSDSQGNIVGSFTFVGGDGVSRSVQYTSRGDEGFVASGTHLPSSGRAVVNNVLDSKSVEYARTSSHVKSGDASNSGFHLHKYMPPENPHKFGYIFDTKA
ncbi:hypothetical protein L9F63_000610 [Diploptera punctata]|uniref:Uncharacterized protein n=1 Tax=Diploptera punctata TaxID=6984 RepID=A0AAD8AM37_DIPPU|nr:hypothetical protein L9F63_000610 [Diploptera punctata]